MTRKLRVRLTGVAFLLVMALAVWLSLALYAKQFTPVATVTLYTDSVGNEMQLGAQVMMRGVQVGEVRQISADGHGAKLVLAIQPGMLPRLPANVTAEMLPTTLFGERYVDLLPPPNPVTARLTSGSVIGQNRSADAVELEHVINNLLPALSAIEPDKLSITLTAIAQGLRGRGTELGHTLVTLNSYLGKFNPQLPTLDSDIRELAGFAKTYNQATPSIIASLNDLTVTSETVAAQRANLSALFTDVTSASNDLRTFLDANTTNIIALSGQSTPTLRILARYAPEFPCNLRDLVNFEPNINKALGAGTKQHGLHVNVVVVPSSGQYLPGKDTPKYGDSLGPHCYSVPFSGIRLNDGASPPPSGGAAAAAAMPGMSGLLVGPVVRGGHVSVTP